MEDNSCILFSIKVKFIPTGSNLQAYVKGLLITRTECFSTYILCYVLPFLYLDIRVAADHDIASGNSKCKPGDSAPQLKWLSADFSPWSLGFAPRPVDVGLRQIWGIGKMPVGADCSTETNQRPLAQRKANKQRKTM